MSPRRSVQTGRRNAYADSPSIQRSLANGGFLQEDVAKPSIQRPSGLGRIQPFRPGGTFEAFGRTARHWTVDAVSSNGGLLAPKSCHLRGRATAKTAHKPSLCPRRARVCSLPKISRRTAETLATAGFQRESGLFMDGQLSLAERAPGTCSQSITLLLKPALMLGLGCMSPLSRALKSAGCSQTLTMR